MPCKMNFSVFFLNTVVFLVLLGRKVESSSIRWFDCPQNGTVPITCGTLSVPLDYTNTSSNATIDLQLVRVNATKQPAKGSVLFNPGGPGDVGRDVLTGSFAAPYLLMTGEIYDLIAFDPRGVGETLPFSCYDSVTERLVAGILSPVASDESDAALGRVWTTKKMLAETCYQKANDTGELIGTAFVARDMIQIVDALNQDGKLRYWGQSYGTALGETVAAMFPDRVERMVLDGVLNPHEYYAGWNPEQLAQFDSTFEGWVRICFANPVQCPLAQAANTADELIEELYKVLEHIKYEPIAFSSNITQGLADDHSLRPIIYTSLYSPLLFGPLLADLFLSLLTRNSTLYFTAYTSLLQAQAPGGSFPQYSGPENLQGIRCSDSALRTKNLTSLLPLVEEYYEVSRIGAGIQLTAVELPCAEWTMRAKEVYSGPFANIRTRHPVLFVTGPNDPVTSVVAAYNASAAFPGSVVLKQTGYGHTSIAQASLCTGKHIREYFVNGTLPAPDTQCEPSLPLFGNSTEPLPVFQPLANLAKRGMTQENDDELLLSAMSLLGRQLATRRRLV